MQAGSSNPMLNHGRFQEAEYSSPMRRGGVDSGKMTVSGAVDKTALTLVLAMTAAAFTWSQVYTGAMAGAAVMTMTQVSGIVGIVVALGTMFMPHWSPVTAPVYAIAKGLALGGMSAFMELMYPGIVVQALVATFGTLFALLAAFKTKIISVTEGFRSMVYMATGGFFLGMLAMMLLRLCGVPVPMASGPLALGVGLVSTALAAFNLLIDFDDIRSTAWQGAPKWMEWYSAFSLLVTLVWMYTSILRVLSLLAGGRDD
uniref:Bax inhibitor-1/YccA family protein n=1 Tax=Tetraselmis chuii TaxID=63592 RepID=A0A7S1SYJ3_9CHLO